MRVEGLQVQRREIRGSFKEKGIRWFEVLAKEKETCMSEEGGFAIRWRPTVWDPGCGVLQTVNPIAHNLWAFCRMFDSWKWQLKLEEGCMYSWLPVPLAIGEAKPHHLV